MRVTQAGADLTMIANLGDSLSRLSTLQQQVSTGRAINRPSDNPGGTATALGLNAQIGRFGQYGANAADGTAWLDTADSALGSVQSSLQKAQTLLLEGANASGSDANTRASLARQVTTIKQSLLEASATRYQGRPVFSGTWGSDPYAGASSGDYTYTGSPSAQTRTIGPGQTQQIGVTADTVFGSGSSSVFALLDKISADLTSGSPNLGGSDLTTLQAAAARATDAQGQIGAWGAQLRQVSQQSSEKVTSLRGSVAAVVDVDMAAAATELQLQHVAYQASLATTAKIIQPSLVSFLA